jgi:PAS domain S-box-containing protein
VPAPATERIPRRQAEAAIAASQELSRQLIAASPVGIAVFAGDRGACIQMNEAGCALVGCTSEQALGLDLGANAPWDEPELLAAARSTFADGQRRSGEFQGRSRFGRELWLAYDLLRIDGPTAPRLLLQCDDITQRKRWEAAQSELLSELGQRVAERTVDLGRATHDLAERERHLHLFRTVIEQNPAAVIIADRAGCITYVNPAFTRQTGFPAAAALGTDLWDCSADADARAQADAMRQAIAEHGSWHGEFTRQRREGGVMWVDVQVAALHDDLGRRIALVAFHHDITAVKEAQAEARRRTEELAQADKMAALGTLVAGVGHEINNPANFISLNAPLLKGFWESALPVIEERAAAEPGFTLNQLPWERVRLLVPKLFSGIEEGIDRIRRIVGDLRDFARPDPGAYQPVHLGRVVVAATAITRHATAKATRHLQCRLANDLPPVLGSFQKLEQVVVNLLLNACQALPGPDRAVSIETRLDPDGRQILLIVADEGVGIPAEHLARLGEPFFTTRRDRGGTGLGVSVTRRIVEEHGGRLAYASTPGQGTTVTVSLPALRGPVAAPGAIG